MSGLDELVLTGPFGTINVKKLISFHADSQHTGVLGQWEHVGAFEAELSAVDRLMELLMEAHHITCLTRRLHGSIIQQLGTIHLTGVSHQWRMIGVSTMVVQFSAETCFFVRDPGT